MTISSPPLRFLVIVLGGWVLIRAADITSLWWRDRQQVPVPAVGMPADAAPPPVAPYSTPSPVPGPADFATSSPGWGRPSRPVAERLAVFARRSDRLPSRGASGRTAAPPPSLDRWAPGSGAVASDASLLTVAPSGAAPAPPALPAAIPDFGSAGASPSRWAGGAWAFFREGSSRSLAAGSGTLGGSQLGARVSYRVNQDAGRPLALFGRAYVPLGDASASEVAAGIEWKPVAAVPIRVAVERRQAITDDGRSAFSLLAYGGVSDRPVGPALLDVYAQAGVVGLRAGDLFADGSASLGVPIDRARRIRAGGGVWGAAQPGLSRLDVGPQVTARIPIGRTAARISADWRFRIAGGAAPSSGPALTIATDF